MNERREDILDITTFPRFLRLTNEDVNRWKRVSDLIGVYTRTPPSGYKSMRLARLAEPFRKTLNRRICNWPNVSAILEDPLVFLAFTAAALIYGGLHALAWSANFRTPTEQTLWRLSACVVMASNPLILIFFTIWDKILDWTEDGHSWKTPLNAIASVNIILMGLVILAYTLARAYLVVECFISLTHLPAGAFDVPNWAAYFPHI